MHYRVVLTMRSGLPLETRSFEEFMMDLNIKFRHLISPVLLMVLTIVSLEGFAKGPKGGSREGKGSTGGADDVEIAFTQAQTSLHITLEALMRKMNDVNGFTAVDLQDLAQVLPQLYNNSQAAALALDKTSTEKYVNSNGSHSWIRTSPVVGAPIEVRTLLVPDHLRTENLKFFLLHELAHQVPWIGLDEAKASRAAGLVQRAIAQFTQRVTHVSRSISSRRMEISETHKENTRQAAINGLVRKCRRRQGGLDSSTIKITQEYNQFTRRDGNMWVVYVEANCIILN